MCIIPLAGWLEAGKIIERLVLQSSCQVRHIFVVKNQWYWVLVMLATPKWHRYRTHWSVCLLNTCMDMMSSKLDYYTCRIFFLYDKSDLKGTDLNLSQYIQVGKLNSVLWWFLSFLLLFFVLCCVVFLFSFALFGTVHN